jgi:hypothetical protein
LDFFVSYLSAGQTGLLHGKDDDHASPVVSVKKCCAPAPQHAAIRFPTTSGLESRLFSIRWLRRAGVKQRKKCYAQLDLV